jgi:hypothetical protein
MRGKDVKKKERGNPSMELADEANEAFVSHVRALFGAQSRFTPLPDALVIGAYILLTIDELERRDRPSAIDARQQIAEQGWPEGACRLVAWFDGVEALICVKAGDPAHLAPDELREAYHTARNARVLSQLPASKGRH